MEKIIKVGDKEVKFKSTSGAIRRYREYFGGDYLKEMIKMTQVMSKITDPLEQFENLDIDIFEKMAWVMAKTADDSIPNITEWLDDFEPFAIMQILPELVQLMVDNMKQLSEPKKKIKEEVES